MIVEGCMNNWILEGEKLTAKGELIAAALPSIISGLMSRQRQPGYTDEGAMVEAAHLSVLVADAILDPIEEE